MSEGRSIRVAPGSRQKGGARAGAGSLEYRGSQLFGHLAEVACTPERPACRSIQLSLPSSPARGREEGDTTSNHQVRRAARILAQAQAQACGADTQGCTANRSSGGAGKGSSPAFSSCLFFLRLSRCRIGGAEEGPEVDFCNPEGESCPGLVLMFSRRWCFSA